MDARAHEDAPAPAEPVARLLTMLMPMALALYANFQGAQQILVPLQIEAINPGAKIANMALITMIGSVTGVLGLTAGGAASDATRGRWGRRAPWLAGMAILSAFLSVGLGEQRALLGVAALSGALWFSLNCFQGAMLAVTPDRVPDRRRGVASSVLGVAGPLGAVVGVNVAAFAPSVWGYAILAAMLMAGTVAFVVFAREPAYSAPPAPRVATRPGLRHRMSAGLFGSFASRDFALAYTFRLLMFIAQFSINNYLLYILQDMIGAANLPSGEARIAAGALNSLRTVATVATILFATWLAHRTQQRRIFAQVYAVLMAAAMLIPALSPTWPGMLAFGILGGVAIGCYSVIDLTLMSRVLPNPNSAGRDIALLVMAGASAQMVAPVFGGICIRWFGYDSLFEAAAFVTLLAGGVMSLIRGVR